MKRLSIFANDEGMREEVFEYLNSILDKATLKSVYVDGKAEGYKEAKEILIIAKSQIIKEFVPQKAKEKKSSV